MDVSSLRNRLPWGWRIINVVAFKDQNFFKKIGQHPGRSETRNASTNHYSTFT
jgi:hypothetical protein